MITWEHQLPSIPRINNNVKKKDEKKKRASLKPRLLLAEFSGAVAISFHSLHFFFPKFLLGIRGKLSFKKKKEKKDKADVGEG